MTLTANGPHRIQPLLPPGPEVRAGGRVRGLRQVTVEVVPDRRGVVESVIVEVASSSPFGMLWWATEVVVPLPRPLHVAPRTGVPDTADEASDDRSGLAVRRTSSVAGDARGIRQYQPGDLKRTVHWPATSHTGTLMVSETERATESPVKVDVSLPADPQAAEREAERVMAVVSGYLSRGVPVLVCSLEAGGPTVGLVLDRIEFGAATGPGGVTPVDPVGRVVEANRPGPAEDSVQFRVASALVVVIAIAACWRQSELESPTGCVRHRRHHRRQRPLLPAP